MVTRNFWDFELVPRTSQLRLESCILTMYIIEIEVEDLMKDVNKRLTTDTLMYLRRYYTDLSRFFFDFIVPF